MLNHALHLIAITQLAYPTPKDDRSMNGNWLKAKPERKRSGRRNGAPPTSSTATLSPTRRDRARGAPRNVSVACVAGLAS